MSIINCTPHEIVFRRADGLDSRFLVSGILPRVETIETPAQPFVLEEGCDDLLVFEAVTQRTGEVTGLPEPRTGEFLIVSGMVFAASDRPDLLAPDTGKTAIRDEKGQIVAVTRFLRK